MNEVLRQEKKFLINLEQYYKYSNDLGNILELDSHSRRRRLCNTFTLFRYYR